MAVLSIICTIGMLPAPRFEQCVNSLLHQDNGQVEIVLVAVEQNSHLLDEARNRLEKRGGGFVYLGLSADAGLMESQVAGMKAASGRYILFMDENTWLEPKAGSLLAKKLARRGPDVLQLEVKEVNAFQEVINPRPLPAWGRFSLGSNPLRNYLNGIIPWDIRGKVFSRALRVGKADDMRGEAGDNGFNMPLCLQLLSRAKTCDFCSDVKFYCFLSEKEWCRAALSPDCWKRHCDANRSLQNILCDILERGNVDSREYRDFLLKLQTNLVGKDFGFLRDVHAQDLGERLAQMFAVYPPALIAARIGYANFGAFCQAVALNKNHQKRKEIKHVALFSRILYGGGSERAAVALAENFTVNGYRTTLMTDNPPHPEDYPYNQERVVRIVLPKDRFRRWRMIQALVHDKEVDACLFFDHWHLKNMFDIAAVSLTPAFCIAMERNMFFWPLYHFQGMFKEGFWPRQYAYRLADALTCLSKQDVLWWKACGIEPVVMIRNILALRREVTPKTSPDDKIILFVGGMGGVKGEAHLLHMLKMVRRRVPEARLVFVGKFRESGAESEMKRLIKFLELDDAVIFTGHAADVSHYFRSAAVHVMPSASEGSPMVLREAKAYGVPSVVFDMKYIELGSLEEGTAMVGKADIHGMTDAVVKLLTEPDHWREMSRRSLCSLEEYTPEKNMEQWTRIFRGLEDGSLRSTKHLPQDGWESFLELTLGEMHSALFFEPPYNKVISCTI